MISPQACRLVLLLAILLDSAPTLSVFLSPFQAKRHHGYQCTLSGFDGRDDGSPTKILWTTLLDRLQGDFDNYQQVLQDRKDGLLPREGGGHEHIHCTLIPVHTYSRLAAFYFDGFPDAIFRFRYYQLVPHPEDETIVRTVLYTLHPILEQLLRDAASDPLHWPQIFRQYQVAANNARSDPALRLLSGCDVQWSWKLDPEQHDYALSYDKQKLGSGIHAVMVNGEALVESQMMPGRTILIKDQLSLWQDEFWIHDRGYDPVSKQYIYGNQREVPYQLERVTKISSLDGDLVRTVTNKDLQWTLGSDFRTSDLYIAKLNAIGGSSVPPRSR